MTRPPIRYAPAAPAGLILLLIGCSELTRNPRADEANRRWSHMRASVKLQLAEKSFANGAIDDALKQCNEVIRLDPEFVEGHLLATRIHLERGETSKAQAALSIAQAQAPMATEAFYLQGLIAERQGRSDDALKHYRKTYQGSPDELDFLLTYVEALIAADQYEKALEIITPRRMDFEQTPAVHALTGQALSLMGRPAEAAQCYQFALHLAPDNPLLREEAGIAFLAAGWDEEVIEALMPSAQPQTTQPSKEHAAQLSIGALRALATALLRAEMIHRAGRVLERAVEEHAEDPALWLMLAEAHLRSDDLTRAAPAADKAATLAPGNDEAQLLLAYVALETGRTEDAIGAARRVLDRNPDDIEARALLAGALERTPDGRAKAAEQYRRILAILPDHRWCRLQLERLNQQARAE